MRLPALLLALFLTSCAARGPMSLPPVDHLRGDKPAPIVPWWSKLPSGPDRGFQPADMAEWVRKADQRYERPVVVVLCHGSIELPWSLVPDPPRKPVVVDDAAKMLANLYPDREIVFVSCNPNHVRLITPHVAYALDNVWIEPGPDDRWWMEYVGTIDEFVEGKGTP